MRVGVLGVKRVEVVGGSEIVEISHGVAFFAPPYSVLILFLSISLWSNEDGRRATSKIRGLGID